MASLIDKVETLVHLKERRGHKLINSFNQTSSPCLNLLWKIQINENEIKFHHSTSLTSSVNKTVCQKAGNTKETYSFKFTCFVGHVSKNRKSERIQHKTSRCFFQTSLGRCAAVPLVLLYKQNTIEPKNKAIIFVPKRTCLFLDTMDVDSYRITYGEVRKRETRR